MSRIKIVRTRIPKFCYCPSCGLKQPFKKYHEHWKTVKDFNTVLELLKAYRIT